MRFGGELCGAHVRDPYLHWPQALVTQSCSMGSHTVPDWSSALFNHEPMLHVTHCSARLSPHASG